MQVLAVKNRADHDAPGFGLGTEVPRQELHGKGMGGPGALLQSPGVIRRLSDGAQRLPYVCPQAVDEGPPLGEELRGAAAGVVAALADPDPGQGHERGELVEEVVAAADGPGGVGGARAVGACAGRCLASAQFEAEPEPDRGGAEDAELSGATVVVCPGPPGRFAVDHRAGLGAGPESLRLRRTGGGQSAMGGDDAGVVDHEKGHHEVSPVRPGARRPAVEQEMGGAGARRRRIRRRTSRPRP